jgi:predicted dehydrogenase
VTHRRVGSGDGEPLRVVLVGAGSMGRAWLLAIAAEPLVELAAVVDLNLDAAREALAATNSPAVPVGSDAVALARATGALALIDVTVPAAHHPITTAALFAGLPVLGEKPAAATLAEALSLCAAAEVTGQLFMVSQSRRWNPRLAAFRELLAGLGPVATLTTQFFKAAHFGGFREQMADPLLVDMAIHAFDCARFLLEAEPVVVHCEAYNPPWSWFAGNAAASAVFSMDSGARYGYDGSWCAPGAETSWNGDWRASAQYGSVLWDGERPPVSFLDKDHAGRRFVDGPADAGRPAPVGDGAEGIAGALQAFAEALRSGQTPDGEVHGNVMSLAMVEAAVRSAATGHRVLLHDVLEQAHHEAVRAEPRDDVQAALRSWTDLPLARSPQVFSSCDPFPGSHDEKP